MSILLGLKPHVNTLIAINIPTGVFAAFFCCSLWWTLWFWGCCTSSKSQTTTCHFLVFLSSIVEHVKANKCYNRNAALNSQKALQDLVHFLGWDGKFCRKTNQNKPKRPTNCVMILPLVMYIFNIFSIRWLTCMLEYSLCQNMDLRRRGLSMYPFSWLVITVHMLFSNPFTENTDLILINCPIVWILHVATYNIRIHKMMRMMRMRMMNEGACPFLIYFVCLGQMPQVLQFLNWLGLQSDVTQVQKYLGRDIKRGIITSLLMKYSINELAATIRSHKYSTTQYHKEIFI